MQTEEEHVELEQLFPYIKSFMVLSKIYQSQTGEDYNDAIQRIGELINESIVDATTDQSPKMSVTMSTFEWQIIIHALGAATAGMHDFIANNTDLSAKKKIQLFNEIPSRIPAQTINADGTHSQIDDTNIMAEGPNHE